MVDWTPPAPGPWQQDQAHTPSSNTLVMQELYPAGFNRGFSETFSRYGLLLDRLAMSVVNGFTYHQPQPFDMPGPDGPKSADEIGAEFERRIGVAAETLATKRWLSDLDDWDREWKPAAKARHRELAAVDLASLDTAGLVDHLRVVADHVGQMTYQHHRFNMAAVFPVGDFALHAAQWTGRDPASLLAVLDGYSPISAVRSDELTPVVDAIGRDESLRELVQGPGDPAARLAELRQRCAEVDDYVRQAGCRLVEGFDVVSPTQAERPELVLGRIAVAIDADPDEAIRRSDAFAAALRDDVPAEHQAAFDEMLADARALYRLRDERGVHSDISSMGLLRWAMLEFGRRLEADGRIDKAEHALDATTDELVSLLGGGAEPTAGELSSRREQRIALTIAGAPRHLGPPPPAPPPVDELPPPLARLMGGTGFMIEGILGQLEAAGGDDRTVIGVPAARGVVEGNARIVRELDDLFEVEPGEVLVTPSTGEAFNSMLHLVSAIVTDHGSFACHAGIVSREMGIPAVVGTVDGSRRIQPGARVRVDGDTGEVTILG